MLHGLWSEYGFRARGACRRVGALLIKFCLLHRYRVV